MVEETTRAALGKQPSYPIITSSSFSQHNAHFSLSLSSISSYQSSAVQRYSPQSYLFYSVMKSPSYFIWARDICGVQENRTSADGSLITVLQTSVDNEEFIPDAGSYAKSRTRATVELSGWKFEKKGEDTELTYVVKILLNGE